MPETQHDYPDVVANYLLQECLGSGFSGSIFRGVNVYNGQQAAVKLQPVDVDCPTNMFERNFYPAIQGGMGIPSLHACGVQGKYDYLVIDLLGPSLDSLFRKSGKDIMDLRSVCCIAMQVISRLEHMHGKGVLHRDIQLGNCVVGLGSNKWLIYMIDFGFSKFFIDQTTRRHIPDSKEPRDFIGNYWFTSVGVHCKGKVPSRRDDMEAVALMLIHLLTPGGLSWTRNGVPRTDAEHDRLIREKRKARPEDLCRGLPAEFEEFLRYCRRLKFEACPDYNYWVNEFRELLGENGYPTSSRFVWPPLDPKPAVRTMPPARRPPANDTDMVGILNELANLQIGERPVLANRNAMVNGVRVNAAEGKKSNTTETTIVLSSGDENTQGKGSAQLPKAAHLAKLRRTVSQVTNNEALAEVVDEFVQVLQTHRSRTLTKEAFAFLDALYKQLADPSVYVRPMRTSLPRDSAEARENAPVQRRYAKQNKLWLLRRDVARARNNQAIAQMVVEFGATINKSSGRTITKDAFAFLDGLSERLRTLA